MAFPIKAKNALEERREKQVEEAKAKYSKPKIYFDSGSEDIKAEVPLINLINRLANTQFVADRNEIKTNCPFPDHPDDNPSFSFSTLSNLFFCQACNRAGDIFNFMAEWEGLDCKTDFPKVKKKICEVMEIAVPDTYNSKRIKAAEPIEEEPKEESKSLLPSIDHEALIPRSGWLKTYVDITSTGNSIPKLFHYVTGLGILSTIIGNRIEIEDISGLQYCNSWFVIITGSGGGKTVAFRPAGILLRDDELWLTEDFILPHNISIEAADEEFEHFPERLLFGSELKSALDVYRRSYNTGKGKGQSGFAKLTDTFDTYCWEKSRVGKSGERKGYIKNVALSILGASTIPWLIEALDPEHYSGGLWPRFLFLYIPKVEFDENPSYFGDELARVGSVLTDIRKRVCLGPFRAKFENIKEVMIEFGREIKQELEALGTDPKSQLLEGVIRRQVLYAKKISTLIALSDVREPRPTLEHWEKAVALVKYSTASHKYLVTMELCFSQIEKDRRDVFKVIIEKPGISKSEITKKTQRIGKRTRDEILIELEEAKMIRIEEEPSEGGRPVFRYWPYAFKL